MSLQKKFEQAARATDRYTDIIVKDRVYKEYKKSLDVVRSQTATLYEKHAKDGILSMSEVSKYNRLGNLEKDITAEMTRLGGKQVRATTKAIKGVYQESAYRTAYALNTEMPDIALNFGLLPTKQVEAAILNPMDRIGWPNRTREQIAAANRQVREVITQGIIQGKPYPDMARDIKERFDMAAYKAERIVRTEAGRARSMGQLATLEEAQQQGVEMVKVWISAMDDRVRDSHGAMDGQKVPVFEEDGSQGMFTSGAGNKAPAKGLFGIAKEDINCRCDMRGEVPGYEPTERRERLTEEEYQARKAAEAERAAKEKRDPLPIARSEVKPYRTYPEYAKEKGFPSLYKGAEPRIVGAVAQVFTPAKTVAEAEEYAKKFAGSADYSRLPIDVANEVNRELTELTAKHGLDFNKIGYRQNMTLYDNVMEVKRAKVSIIEGGKIVGERDIVDLNINPIFFNHPEYEAILKRQFDAGWSYSENIKDLLTHEMGHAVTGKQYGVELLRSTPITNITKRGAENISESIAELFLKRSKYGADSLTREEAAFLAKYIP